MGSSTCINLKDKIKINLLYFFNLLAEILNVIYVIVNKVLVEVILINISLFDVLLSVV